MVTEVCTTQYSEGTWVTLGGSTWYLQPYASIDNSRIVASSGDGGKRVAFQNLLPLSSWRCRCSRSGPTGLVLPQLGKNESAQANHKYDHYDGTDTCQPAIAFWTSSAWRCRLGIHSITGILSFHINTPSRDVYVSMIRISPYIAQFNYHSDDAKEGTVVPDHLFQLVTVQSH